MLVLEGAAERPLTRARLVALTLAAVMVVHHAAVWAWVTRHEGIAWSTLLTGWDSEHYNAIIRDGYSGSLFAFLPLYPWTVAALWALLGRGVPPEWVGALLSLCCFLAFVGLASRARTEEGDAGLRPRTGWGWFVFLFSPASYVFHSHHGEALFLLLSYAALTWAWQRRWRAGALAAGLSVLARNQGVLVGLATAALTYVRHPAGPGRRRALAGTFAIGAASGVALLAAEYALSGGNALAHLEAQRSWRQVQSLEELLRTFWWGNPWQRLYLDSALHHLLWFALGAIALVLRGPSRPLALYVWASLALMPLQAELINVYRYGAVLFPAWFALGDGLARAPAWVRWPAAIGWVLLNHQVTYNFALERWAY
ncbi:MAG TPA: hypothetical protein VFO83_00370 [Aggregicoccus sp.]|nr:hypothetical protein [Aggregicoccus sp.]